MPVYERGSSLGLGRSVLSGFDETLVVGRSPVLSLNGALPLSELRNVTSVSAGASIDATSSPGEVWLGLTAAPGVFAQLESRQAGIYTPGYQAQVGIGIRRPVAPSGSQVWTAGLFDGNNGFLIRETSAGLEFDVASGGVITQSVPQASWNIDRLDGSGPSGFALNLAEGVIAQIDFTYYGYGTIQLSFVIDAPAGQRRVTAHTVSISGVSTQNPNLPVYVRAENGATASAFDLYIGGRQYSIVGNPARNEARIVAASRLALAGVATTYVPLVSFQPRVTSPRAEYMPESFDTIADADHLLSLWLNPTLTGAAFGAIADVPTSDTLLEVDTAATAMTGGIKLWEGLAVGSTNQNRNMNSSSPIDVGSRGIVTLAARRISGTGMTISGSLRMMERW